MEQTIGLVNELRGYGIERNGGGLPDTNQAVSLTKGYGWSDGMPKLLIVEDNVFFRQTLARILLNSFPSVEIAEAADGQQAFSAIDTQRPQLIFTDIGLPGKDGIQLTKEISDRFPEIAIIVISNYDTSKYREAALNAGAAVFMSKEASTPADIVETAKKTLPELSA